MEFPDRPSVVALYERNVWRAETEGRMKTEEETDLM